MVLDLNGELSYPRIHKGQVLIEPYFDYITSPPHPRKSLFATNGPSAGEVRLSISHVFYDTDTPNSLYDYSDNCCDKDVSLSYKLLLFQRVRHFPLLFSGQH